MAAAARGDGAGASGLTRAYSTVRVDPDKFLLQLRAAYRVPISGYHGVLFAGDWRARRGGRLDHPQRHEGRGHRRRGTRAGRVDHDCARSRHSFGDHHADDSEAEPALRISSSTPTTRSPNCGLPRPARPESTSAASCWKKKWSTNLCRASSRALRRKASAEVVEKWAGRLIPLASSAIGAGLNYWFVRAWGERAKQHFRQRHLPLRQRAQQTALAAPSQPSLPARQSACCHRALSSERSEGPSNC